MLLPPLDGYARVQRPSKRYRCRHIKKANESRRNKKRRRRKNGR